jgi:hypothetical protein
MDARARGDSVRTIARTQGIGAMTVRRIIKQRQGP